MERPSSDAAKSLTSCLLQSRTTTVSLDGGVDEFGACGAWVPDSSQCETKDSVTLTGDDVERALACFHVVAGDQSTLRWELLNAVEGRGVR